MTRYAHTFDLAITVVTNEPNGEPTGEELRKATIERLAELSDDYELINAAGSPIFTHELLDEEDLEVTFAPDNVLTIGNTEGGTIGRDDNA